MMYMKNWKYENMKIRKCVGKKSAIVDLILVSGFDGSVEGSEGAGGRSGGYQVKKPLWSETGKTIEGGGVAYNGSNSF